MHELLSFNDIILKDAPDVSQPLTFTTTTNSVDMAEYDLLYAVLIITDAATGCAVTMKYGTTSTANTALSFTRYYYKADIATSNAWVEGEASSNTFTTGVASKTGVYAVPVQASMLQDAAAGARWVRMNCASTANATGTLLYIQYNPRWPSDPADLVDASS
jgi:hypothetical protein